MVYFVIMETEEKYLRICLEKIGTSYEGLRIVRPSFEIAMEQSLKQHGQITAVMVVRDDKGAYEMVDGFKRLRAGCRLGLTDLLAKIIPYGERSLKAAMITFNLKGRTISELEQGLILQSLHRDNSLPQKEIAVLLGRHKSYVSRRIALVEKLSDEVLTHIRLGLINVTIGRELSRLPRGNQDRTLAAILKHKLDTRESHRLVTLLLKEPACNHEKILYFPEPIFEDRCPPHPRLALVDQFLKRLLKIELWLSKMPLNSDMTEPQWRKFNESMDRIRILVNCTQEIN
jgi:ParB/RepB/Spo0J family partition protein